MIRSGCGVTLYRPRRRPMTSDTSPSADYAKKHNFRVPIGTRSTGTSRCRGPSEGPVRRSRPSGGSSRSPSSESRVGPSPRLGDSSAPGPWRSYVAAHNYSAPKGRGRLRRLKPAPTKRAGSLRRGMRTSVKARDRRRATTSPSRGSARAEPACDS